MDDPWSITFDQSSVPSSRHFSIRKSVLTPIVPLAPTA